MIRLVNRPYAMFGIFEEFFALLKIVLSPNRNEDRGFSLNSPYLN